MKAYKSFTLVSKRNMSAKTLHQRLAESTNIHQQLQKLGVLLNDESRFKLRIASNEFVKTGFSSTFRLAIDDNSRAIVQFRNDPTQRSGVILEY